MEDYIPYGEEWVKEMSKLPKDAILRMFSKMGIEKNKELKQLQSSLKEKEKECDELKKFPAEWYTKKTLHTHLTQNNYSADIADELPELFATSLQGAFRKGWEKGYNDFNPEKSTFNYKYYSELESKQIEELKAENERLKSDIEQAFKDGQDSVGRSYIR